MLSDVLYINKSGANVHIEIRNRVRFIFFFKVKDIELTYHAKK